MARSGGILIVIYRMTAILFLAASCSFAQIIAPPSPSYGYDWRPLSHLEFAEVCAAISDLSAGLGWHPRTPSHLVSAAQASANVMWEMKARQRIRIVDPSGSPGEGTGGFTTPTRVAIGDEVGFGSTEWWYYDPEFGSGDEYAGLGGALFLISDPALRRCHVKAVLAHEAQRVCQEVCGHPSGAYHESVRSEKEWLKKTLLAHEIGYFMMASCNPPGWPGNRAATPDFRLHATLLLGAHEEMEYYRARLARLRCPE